MSDEEQKNRLLKRGPEHRGPINTNLERVMDTIDNLGERFESGITKYVNFKSEQAEKERKHESQMNKRAGLFSVSIIVAFLIMWLVAMLMEQFEMANRILLILLATGAGAGITRYLNA